MTYFKQLNTYDSKHELQKKCDEHYVVDRLHSNNDTLNNMLRAENTEDAC